MTDAWAGSVCHQYGVALNTLTLVEMNFHSCRKFSYYSNILGIRLPFMYLIAKPKTWESNSFSYIIYSLPFFKKTIRDLNISDFILFWFVLFIYLYGWHYYRYPQKVLIFIFSQCYSDWTAMSDSNASLPSWRSQWKISKICGVHM